MLEMHSWPKSDALVGADFPVRDVASLMGCARVEGRSIGSRQALYL